MAHLRQMVNISNELAQAINNFPIGMITLESFKTTHEKIKDVQRELRHLDAKFFELRATKLNSKFTGGGFFFFFKWPFCNFE